MSCFFCKKLGAPVFTFANRDSMMMHLRKHKIQNHLIIRRFSGTDISTGNVSRASAIKTVAAQNNGGGTYLPEEKSEKRSAGIELHSSVAADVSLPISEKKTNGQKDVDKECVIIFPELQMVTRATARQLQRNIDINLRSDFDKKKDGSNIMLMPALVHPDSQSPHSQEQIVRTSNTGTPRNRNGRAQSILNARVGNQPVALRAKRASSAIGQLGNLLLRKFARDHVIYCYKCSKNIGCRSYEQFANHAMGVHLKKPLFTCRLCGKQCVCRTYLAVHIRTTHREHSAIGRYNDNRNQYEAEIKQCLIECFDASKQQQLPTAMKSTDSRSSIGEMSNLNSTPIVELPRIPTDNDSGQFKFNCCFMHTNDARLMKHHQAIVHRKY